MMHDQRVRAKTSNFSFHRKGIGRETEKLCYDGPFESKMGIVFGIISEETPKYTVLDKKEGFEIRRYNPYVVAETTYDESSGSKEGSGSSFRTLANYIGVFSTPENTSRDHEGSEAISMTAAVMTEKNQDSLSSFSMQFMLPSKYSSVQEAPLPKCDNVLIRNVPEKIFAVSTFSGGYDMHNCGEKVEELREKLKANAIQITGPWRLVRFNPPFTVWFLRTNEIHFEVECK